MILFLLGSLITWAIGSFWFFVKWKNWQALANTLLMRAEKASQDLREKAERDAAEIYQKKRQSFEENLWQEQQRTEKEADRLREREWQIKKREEGFHKEAKRLKDREKDLEKEQCQMEDAKKNIVVMRKQLQETLANISSLSLDEAYATFRNECRNEILKELHIWKEAQQKEIDREVEMKAKELLLVTLQRMAVPTTAETTTVTVALPNEDIKGRIIGREGRNIRIFEQLTGVNLIIDDTPCAVILSSFDPKRRALAEKTLEHLIHDGRIHPSRIQEVFIRMEKKFIEETYKKGESAAIELGVCDLHPELIQSIGTMHYHRTQGQNLLQHSKEVALLMAYLATELGFSVHLAQRLGLLHDLGKVIAGGTGSHAEEGAKWAKRWGESEEVVAGISSHHNHAKPSSTEALLLATADAISASRPGARMEKLDSYFRRLEDLEKLALSFPHVLKVQALQAGREILVTTSSQEISDEEAASLAQEIRKKIEQELQFPGKIKVVVVRETRAIQYAI